MAETTYPAAGPAGAPASTGAGGRGPAPAGRISRGPLNRTVLRLTARSMLGRRRGVLLFTLPLLLLAISVLVRATAGADPHITGQLLGSFAVPVLVPLVGLIAGTGAIGPEIDDGSIVYLLAKPVSRASVVVSKCVVAVACTVAFAAVPVALSALILSGTARGLPWAYGVGTLCSVVAYSVLFVLLGVVSRHAVVIGLIYVLLWEGLLGGEVPGAQVLSVAQWGVSVAGRIAAHGAVDAQVGIVPAVVLLVVATAGGVWLASRRLARLRLTGEE